VTAAIRRALQRALLAGAPLALGSCLVEKSSCPDNGHEPPEIEIQKVDPSLANGGALDRAQCDDVCSGSGDGVVTCVREAPDSVLCITHPFPCKGRRPSGLRDGAHRSQSGFARQLSDAAWLEAASVDAFRLLRRELRAHGAPRRLLRAASRSARDERRHARATRALARRFGVSVSPVERDASLARSLEELALENAVEGCVRETWGALVALRQGACASEPAVRDAMRRIAREEIRHAELAFRIDRWLAPRLNAEQARRVRDARRGAVAQLASEASQSLPRAERERLGLPSSHEAAVMLAELDRSLGLSNRNA
jgi:hypothetical protein